MYVSPASRQGGFARQLVQAILEEAASRQGVTIVQLTVTEGNAAAQTLYESCGFKSFGVEPYAVALGDAFLSKIHMWRSVGPLVTSG